MSGHSKWATIKHKKGAADQKRAKLFAKLIKQVEVSARQGGGDPDSNPTLRTMFQKARDASVPIDTIERAVKRGTGARGLRAMLESLLRTTMFELPSKQGLEKCEITVEETVEGAPDGGVDPEAQKLVVKEVISEPAPNQGITKEAVPAV